MPIDPVIQGLLASYEDTAQKLMRNQDVSPEELNRFLGVTGILSVQMQRQLWTQEDLRAKIREEQQHQCATCANSKAIEVLTAALKQRDEIAGADAERVGTWRLIGVAVAKNMLALILTIGFIALGAILVVTLTRQLPEAGELVNAAAQAGK